MYEKAGGYDLQYLNHRTYFTDGHAETIVYTKPDPKPDPDPTPDPTPGPVFEVPETLYVLGDIEGAAWDPTHGVEMVIESEGCFISREKVRFVSSRDGSSYFGLTDRLGSDWDDLNAKANRFGPSERDLPLDLNGYSDFSRFSGKDASAANSWRVRPGSYYVKADFNTGRVELAESTAVSLVEPEEDEAPVYYTLQGVRVENPARGIYIRVVRGGCSKVMVR